MFTVESQRFEGPDSSLTTAIRARADGPMVVFFEGVLLCSWYNAPLRESHDMRVLIRAGLFLYINTFYAQEIQRP